MKFECIQCNYSTDIKYCYEKHLTTKKHIEKSKEPIIPSINPPQTIVVLKSTECKCSFCGNIYGKRNLARHKKVCMERQNLLDACSKKDTENLVKELTEKLAYKDNIIATEIARRDDLIKSKDETILILTAETKNLKTILGSAGTLVEKSMSNFNFLNTHYNEAPALTYVTDVSSLHVDLAEDKVANRIMNEYNNNTLTSFIGKLIVKHYKKKNPKEQSIWNSDNDRLTYMIRTILSEKNNQNQWEVDKKGINTTLHIIQPILDHIRKHLKDYIETCDVGSRRDSAETVLAISRRIETAYKIIVAIKKGEIANDILKYISPRLYIVKDLDLIV